jgi:hypothetical protein
MTSNITIKERIKIKALHDQGHGVPCILLASTIVRLVIIKINDKKYFSIINFIFIFTFLLN